MRKKVVYCYVSIVAITVFLGLVIALLGGPDTDARFGLLLLVVPLLMLLLWTSPIFLVALVLILVARNWPLRELLARAERFHTGNPHAH
jgi:hypothetical protein